MSKCSKMCNKIKSKIDSISGLSDDYVFSCLRYLDCQVDFILDIVDSYANADELNGTCFKKREL